MDNNPNYFRIRISSERYFPLIDKKDKHSMYIKRLKYCAFSEQLLRQPIVMCKQGYLFNKDIIIGLIKAELLPPKFRHLKSEDDVREIQTIYNSMRDSEFPLLCPLTNKVLNGSNSFVLNWECGCLLYEKLLFPLAGIKLSMMSIEEARENGSKNKYYIKKNYKCPNCREKFSLNKLYQLNFHNQKPKKGTKI